MASYKLIAVHNIIRQDELGDAGDAPQNILPGKSFTVSDKKEYQRLIDLGAALSPADAAEVEDLEDEAEARRLADEAQAAKEKAAEDKLAAKKATEDAKKNR